jgi:hypothetical protein
MRHHQWWWQQQQLEGTSAEDMLIFNLVVFVANDVIDAAGDNALGRASNGQPAFSGEAGNFGGGRWFWDRSTGIGHGGDGG